MCFADNNFKHSRCVWPRWPHLPSSPWRVTSSWERSLQCRVASSRCGGTNSHAHVHAGFWHKSSQLRSQWQHNDSVRFIPVWRNVLTGNSRHRFSFQDTVWIANANKLQAPEQQGRGIMENKHSTRVFTRSACLLSAFTPLILTQVCSKDEAALKLQCSSRLQTDASKPKTCKYDSPLIH